LDDHFAAADGGLQWDGIAASGLAHRLRYERRGAHLAGDSLAADVEADRAADVAGVGDGDDVAVGLLVEEETDFGAAAFAVVDVDAVAVELVVGDLRGGHNGLATNEGDGGRGGEGGGALGVDELGCGEEDEDEAGDDDGAHPHLFAALSPLGATLVGRSGGGGKFDGRAAFVFEQHHEAGEGEHGDEEEEIVADDGTDEAHLGGAGGKDAVFAELVQAAHHKLKRHEIEDHRGDAEEALQVDLDAAADEEHAEDDGYGDAEKGASKAEEFGGIEGDGGEDQDSFDAFAEDEQEYEEKEADMRRAVVAAGELGNFGFDLAFHGACRLVHEPDHAHHEDGSGEHDPAFDDVGVEVEVGDDDSDTDAGGYGGSESPEDASFQLVAANLGEVGEDDAHDQRCFDPLSEGDDKCLQHKVFLFPERLSARLSASA